MAGFLLSTIVAKSPGRNEARLMERLMVYVGCCQSNYHTTLYLVKDGLVEWRAKEGARCPIVKSQISI